jgi:hypothetical protein
MFFEKMFSSLLRRFLDSWKSNFKQHVILGPQRTLAAKEPVTDQSAGRTMAVDGQLSAHISSQSNSPLQCCSTTELTFVSDCAYSS